MWILRYIYRSSGNVDKSIIIVFVVVSVGAQVYVVHPDVCGAEDRDCIFKGCRHFLVHCVANDDIGCIYDRQANADDLYNSSEGGSG